jgi:hypothetical protein
MLAPLKIEVPILVTRLNRTLTFEWYVFGVAPRKDTKNIHVERVWITCSKNMMIIPNSTTSVIRETSLD